MKEINSYLKVITISLCILIRLEPSTMAQPIHKYQVKAYLNRTVLIIHEAKKQLNTGKNYTGDFAHAIAHQKLARNLFQNGQFQKAGFHSHRARVFAFAVIRDNKGLVNKEFVSTKEEENLEANRPKDDELDRSLLKSEPNITFDDRAAIQVQVKEIEEK
jgi:hypothetical protein